MPGESHARADGHGRGLCVRRQCAACTHAGQARIAGGARAAALVIELRAPSDSLDAAVGAVQALLADLARGATSDALLARAMARAAAREQEARSDPRRRVASLWTGSAPLARPMPQPWRDWLASALAEPRLVIVEARPE